jgi:Tfp pilus assembly protein PilN
MALREINLIPTDILSKRYISRRIFLWSGCLILCLSLIFGFYQYQVQVVLPKKRPVTTLEDMQKQLGTTIEEIKETQQEIQRLSLQESLLKDLTQIQPLSKILLKLSEIMNTRTWLTKLSVDAGAEEEDFVSSIELNGFSLSNFDLGNFLTDVSWCGAEVCKRNPDTQVSSRPKIAG